MSILRACGSVQIKNIPNSIKDVESLHHYLTIILQEEGNMPINVSVAQEGAVGFSTHFEDRDLCEDLAIVKSPEGSKVLELYV